MSDNFQLGKRNLQHINKIKSGGYGSNMVWIKYRDKKGNISTRTVEPYKVDGNDFWGYDPDKGNIRRFKIKNIKSVKPTKISYEPRWEVEMDMNNNLEKKSSFYEAEIYKEANILNKPDLYYNYDDFKSGKKNMVMMSGFSGSGKSTLARKIARDNKAIFVEMDDFKKLIDSNSSAPIVKEYLEKNPGLKGKIKPSTYRKYFNDYLNHAIDYAKRHPDQKFVFEGIQLLNKGDADIPKIVKGTGAATSNFRARKRMVQSGFKRSSPYELLNAGLYPKVKKERYTINKLTQGYNPGQIDKLLRSKRNAKLGAGGAALAGITIGTALGKGVLNNVKGGNKNNEKVASFYEEEIYKEAKMSTFEKLQKNKQQLTPEERGEVLKRKAVWSGNNSAVWKSVDPDTGKTTFVTHTHRAYNTAPTLKGAIGKFHGFIKSTAEEEDNSAEKIASLFTKPDKLKNLDKWGNGKNILFVTGMSNINKTAFEEKQKDTIVFDFDGVIHSYKSGWKGATVIPDEPVEGINEAIQDLRKDYRIVVMSARCFQEGGIAAIKKWLNENDVEVDDVVDKKPPAKAYVDDNGINFDGNAKSLPEKVRTFVPWTEKIASYESEITKIAEEVAYHASPVQDIKKFKHFEDTSGNNKGKVIFVSKEPSFASAFGLRWNDGNARFSVLTSDKQSPTEDNYKGTVLKYTDDVNVEAPASMYKLKGNFDYLRCDKDLEKYTDKDVEIVSEEQFKNFKEMAKHYGLELRNVSKDHIINKLKYKKSSNFEKKADDYEMEMYKTANDNMVNKDGKIPAIEKALECPIARKVATMMATSHEYKTPNVDGALAMAKNYKWEKSTEKIRNLQGINKPVKKEKVMNIAMGIKENKGKVEPFIVVNQLHGIRPQTPGKKVLLDGHHRMEACEFLGKEEVPVYKGTYTGEAQKSKGELREKMGSHP